MFYASDELYDSMTEDQDYWISKYYHGWEHLIRPCINRAVARGHTIQQIKAKFGTLRFYYAIDIPSKNDKVMRDLVSEAEVKSGYTCCKCGIESSDVPELKGVCRLCYDGWLDKLNKKLGVDNEEWT